ncbi:MAG TPA: MG2 domain-containing protein [Thermoanaerobaculia bacterium]|jgi:hypothetical protein
MRLVSIFLALFTWFPLAAPQQSVAPGQAAAAQQPIDALRREAEAFIEEKSFSRAHALYEQAARLDLTADERRWVRFRLADTAWRADAAAPNPDPTVREKALEELQALLRESGPDRDRVWAEVQESLGDFSRTARRGRSTHDAPGSYAAALDWWAGSADLALARRRYLNLVWKMTGDGDPQLHYVSREILANAVEIAETVEERTRARYLLALHNLQQGDTASVERGIELLELVIREGKGTPWYDDALFMLAQRLSNGGVVVLENGETSFESDYVRALELYRRLIREFGKESRYWQEAENAIEEITEVAVDVDTAQTFLPGSEQEVLLSWRNTKSIELTLTAVDLTKDVTLLDEVRVNGGNVVRSWTYATEDRGDHAPGHHRLRITPRLEAGAYVVTARSGSVEERALLLVSDTHILVHAAGDTTHVFVSNVITGEPLADADVTLRWKENNNKIATRTGRTDRDGVARFTSAPGQVSVTAARGLTRQAHHQTWTNHYGGSGRDPWRIYAFTDRPAYRPEETVRWKIIARRRNESRWVTPAGTSITWEITDPRGQRAATGNAVLNEFGSFSAELPLTVAMPLGVYSISFTDGKNAIGAAGLFRLEEYKLPEFRVSVTTPPERRYRLGDTIEATVEATYYFGGAVANATVEAVIYQQPYYRHWYPWREYDWYFPPDAHRYGEQELRRETLRTDAEGRAIVRIETPRDGTEMTYRIEARVVDASRREVTGGGTVRVLRQRYAVVAQPRHYIARPGEPAQIDFKALDANERPVRVTGTVKVVRREMTPRVAGWKDEEVLTTKLDTDAEGNATLTFTPRRNGYYMITWTSEDRTEGQPLRARDVVTATTALWVAEPSALDIGYHASGLQIVVDRESVRGGERVPVMIVTPASGRWVVLSSSAERILDTRVLRLDGTVKLIELEVDERHSPNFFLTASSVFDRTIATTTTRVVVPPVEHFIDVEVKGDRTDYEPRQEGAFTITTRDHTGKPVEAEVALSVTDESVTAIQGELAGDPRQFFFGDTRGQAIQVSGSLSQQQYVKLVETKQGTLVDERYKDRLEKEEEERKEESDKLLGGVVGSAAGGRMNAPQPAPAPVAPPPPPGAVAEAITVTSQAARRDARESAAFNAADLAPPAEGSAAVIAVRSDFRSTAFWQPDIRTDANGTATVRFKFPESLTTWRANATAVSRTTQVGRGTATARTNQPLMVRLQAPRFFVAGDRATVSAVINNSSNAPVTVAPLLEVEGLALASSANAAPLTIPAGGEARAEWNVVAEREGSAKLRVSGRASTHSDAMERVIRVYEHGIDKLVARSGRIRGEEALVRLELPRDRRATQLVVNLQPSLAASMLDALPFLIEFPYGCTEQTMSRFLPAAVVTRTLKAQGLDATSRPELKNLDAVIAAGVARLRDFQHEDGSWGWWKESPGDIFMTAYVVWGFSILGQRDANVDRAVAWLDTQLPTLENRPHDQAWVLHAISAWRAKPNAVETRAFEDAWKNREKLSAYSRALLALTAHRFGNAERAQVLVRNLEDGVSIDRAPDQSVLLRGTGGAPETMQTAHWGAANRFWFRWWEGPVETTAFALQALVTIDPQHRLIEPAMNWLVKNRRGARWHNTRDTAVSLLALNQILANERRAPATSYELTVNGTQVAAKNIAPEDVLRGAIRIVIDPALVKDVNEIRIKKGGDGSLYFAAEARFVSLEEPVTAVGNELFVRRDYFRLMPQRTLLKGVVYQKVPLRDGERLTSNDRVEVVVTVETKNDYEYMLFEDLKPAGLEAVELQSGQPLSAIELRAASVLRERPNPAEIRRAPSADQTGRVLPVYQELRDRNVALFVDKMPQGTWEIRYTLRAETPGAFHALPLLGQAMYVPDVRANGEEVRITVE